MSARILITGSRNWTDKTVIERALYDAYKKFGPDVILVSGNCPTGADALAEKIWETWQLPIERHPARWVEGKSAGPRRNQEMVDLGADVCLVFLLSESRGTRHCMTAAQRADIPVHVYEQEN